jgi:hypothetical protein
MINVWISKLREIRVQYQHDPSMMLYKLKEVLQECTSANLEASPENLANNNALVNEVLEILRYSNSSGRTNSGLILENIDLVNKLPMLPDVRGRLTAFKSGLSGESTIFEIPTKNPTTGFTPPVYGGNDNSKDRRKILVILLALLFLFLGAGLVWYFISRPAKENVYYKDGDGDGYGSAQDTIVSVEKPMGYTEKSGDENDGDPCVPDSSNKACSEKGTDPGNGVDKIFDCPDLAKNFGQSCNDDNPNTFDDRVDETCLCRGRSGTIKWYEDKDGDGIGNSKVSRVSERNEPGFVTISGDCDDGDKNIRRKGDSCDDDNPETINDKVQSDCKCMGTKKIGQDNDSDGIANDKDRCPDRSAPGSSNGCPEIKIDAPESVIKGGGVQVSLSGYEFLKGDDITWSVITGKGKVINPKVASTEIEMYEPGLQTIQVNITGGSDKFNETDTKKICVEYSGIELTKLLEKAVLVGNYELGQFIPSDQKKQAEEVIDLFESITADNVMITVNNTTQGRWNIREFIDAKITTPESFFKARKVIPIYNKSTGKIESIKFTK